MWWPDLPRGLRAAFVGQGPASGLSDTDSFVCVLARVLACALFEYPFLSEHTQKSTACFFSGRRADLRFLAGYALPLLSGQRPIGRGVGASLGLVPGEWSGQATKSRQSGAESGSDFVN